MSSNILTISKAGKPANHLDNMFCCLITLTVWECKKIRTIKKMHLNEISYISACTHCASYTFTMYPWDEKKAWIHLLYCPIRCLHLHLRSPQAFSFTGYTVTALPWWQMSPSVAHLLVGMEWPSLSISSSHHTPGLLSALETWCLADLCTLAPLRSYIENSQCHSGWLESHTGTSWFQKRLLA